MSEAEEHDLILLNESTKNRIQHKVKRIKRKLSETVSYEELLKDWTQCCYLLPHKQKLCNMQRFSSSKYCSAHISQETSAEIKSQVRPRVPCPLDPSHTIYENDLQYHLKVCNIQKYQQQVQQLPYYKPDCNSGVLPLSAAKERPREGDERGFVEELLRKIDQMFSVVSYQPLLKPARQAEEGDGKGLAEGDWSWMEAPIREVLGTSTGNNTDNRDRSSFKHWKHIEQDIAIVKQLIQYSLLTPSPVSTLAEQLPSDQEQKSNIAEPSTNEVYVEYGAGKGLLGMSINLLNPQAALLFIEKSGNRKKIDKYLVDRQCKFQRFRLDIRHCYLPELPFIREAIERSQSWREHAGVEGRIADETLKKQMLSVRIVAKHLCGVATDMAITSLQHLSNLSEDLQRGLAIATCCHHVCEYDDYVGKAVFFDNYAITREEFNVMKYWSAWATLDLKNIRRKAAPSGDRLGIDEHSSNNEPSEHAPPVEERGGDHEKYRAVIDTLLTYEQMLNYGRKIKRVIDYGRLIFIEKVLHLSPSLQQYCEDCYSPEAFMIIGTPLSQPSSDHVDR